MILTVNGLQTPLTVNVSVSPCEDAERLGFDEWQINRIVIRIAQFFLFKGMRVLFGHDWRADGVMQAVLRDAELSGAADRQPRRGARMLNLVATGGTPLSRVGLEAAKDSAGVLEVRSMDDEPVAPIRRGDRCSELWALRQRMTQLLDPGCRICLGGRTSGYSGHYAGVAEEAYFALSMGKPLYLIGGLGGATSAVCDAILGEASPGRDGDRPLDARAAGCAISPGDAPLPLDGLTAAFRAFGIDKLSTDNGLAPEDNRRLFEMSDVEAALGLINKGLTHRSSIAD